MSISGPKELSEGAIDPCTFTALSNFSRSQYTIPSKNTQECPSNRGTLGQMSSNSDEQTKYLNAQTDHNFCESVAPRQDQHSSYNLPCEYGAGDQLWHRPLLNDDVIRLSSLLPQTLLTSAFPAQYLLGGGSFLETGASAVAARNTLLLPQAVHSKDQAFSPDGSSLSLDGYHKSKCIMTTTAADDAYSDDESRIDVCNVKETCDRNSARPSTPVEDQDNQNNEENSEDDSTSLTSLSQLEGQCARTVPGLLKYYARHKWSLSSSLTVSLAVTGQSTPPSSPISPGTFQRPTISSAHLDERLITVNSSDELKLKSKNSKTSLPSSFVPLLTVPKCPLSSATVAASSSLENTPSRRPPEIGKLWNGDMAEKNEKQPTPLLAYKNQPISGIQKADTMPMKISEKNAKSVRLEAPNVVANIADIDPTYRAGLSIGMENLSTHYPIGASTYHNDDIARQTAMLLSQGIDPNMARIGLGYQFVRDPVTGHIILLSNSHHLQSTNPSLLWTGYGSVATTPLLMSPQQLLLNDPHYTHPIHPHLLHLPQHPMQLNKGEIPRVKFGPQGSTRPGEMALPIIPSEIPSATIPPRILYPSTTLSWPGKPLLPMSNFNPKLDTFAASKPPTQSDKACTNTTDSKSCPITTTRLTTYNPAPVVHSKKSQKILQHPKHNKVPFDDSVMEPPMDLTKKKIAASVQGVNNLQQISIDTAMPMKISTRTISVKKEIKQEIMSPNQITSIEKIPLEAVRLKVECFGDISESTPMPVCNKELTSEPMDLLVSGRTRASPELPTTATIDTVNERLRIPFDESGLQLLSHSIQQHEDNHQISGQNSDEELSCCEMPRLEKINLSRSPRHSPSSCELPPVLTPVEVSSAVNFNGYGEPNDSRPAAMPMLTEHMSRPPAMPTLTENINKPPVMPTRYSGLNILCVLAEQELNEKSNNCSALSSLAEVASTHESITESHDVPVSPPRQIHNENLSVDVIDLKTNVISDSQQPDNATPDEHGPSIIDINRNYKNSCQMNENLYLGSENLPFQSSLNSQSMNGREIKVRHQLAEIQRKYKKKRQKLTKLHKKKCIQKKSRLNLTEHRYEQPNQKLSPIYLRGRLSESNEPCTSPLRRLQESSSDVVFPSGMYKDGDNGSDSPVVDFSVEDCGFVESAVSDTDQHSSSSKRKPGRPKKHFLGADELFNSSHNFDFMMVSHKPKILPKLRAELKMRQIDHMDENSDYEGVSFNCDASDDNLPLSTFQHKPVEKISAKSQPNVVRNRLHKKRARLTRQDIINDKEKRKKSVENQCDMEELFRSLKRLSKMAADEHDESEEEKPVDNLAADAGSLSGEAFDGFVSTQAVDGSENGKLNINFSPISEDSYEIDQVQPIDPTESSSSTEQDSSLSGTTESSQEWNVCQLSADDLVDDARVLVPDKGKLYAGSLKPISPPNIYKINIDGERDTMQKFHCQDDILTGMFKEVKPGSTRFLREGTRVCAFWSSKYRDLYTGTIAAASSPSREDNHNYVNVEFDDGDLGRTHIDDVRLLPQDFPLSKPVPNPLISHKKRKIRSTAEYEDTPNIYSGGAASNYADDHEKPSVEPMGTDTSRSANNSMTSLTNGSDAAGSDLEGAVGFDAGGAVGFDAGAAVGFDWGGATKVHKHSAKRRHKHKHRHKEKPGVGPFPRVELGDGELRLRITSPSLSCADALKDWRISLSPTSTPEESTSVVPTPQKIKKPRKSAESKIVAFLPERQLWKWVGNGTRRGPSKKTFYKEIYRDRESIKTGDCAVFLSTGQPERPYIGRIELLWESARGKMEVKVKWFYHPAETDGLSTIQKTKGALFQSEHIDKNDVQTISHICYVIPLAQYCERHSHYSAPTDENDDVYYLAGTYDPVKKKMSLMPGVV